MSLTARTIIHASTMLASSSAIGMAEALGLISLDDALGSGYSAGHVDDLACERYVIPASGTQIVNLSTLVDPIGDRAVFLSAKVLVVKASPGNAAAVTMKPNTTHPWAAPFGNSTTVVRVEAGGLVLLSNQAAGGWEVTEDSADQLLLTNTSGAAEATVDVMLIGVGGWLSLDQNDFTMDNGNITWDNSGSI